MNFTEAVEAMKQGKKIRRNNSAITTEPIWYSEGREPIVRVSDALANDWEIVEEPKKTLWDKRQREDIPKSCWFFEFVHVEDVEVALREFHKWINIETVRDKNCNIIVHIDDVDSKLKEIFGDELVKRDIR